LLNATEAADGIIEKYEKAIQALDTLCLFSNFEDMFGYMEYRSAKTTKLKGGSISDKNRCIMKNISLSPPLKCQRFSLAITDLKQRKKLEKNK
jgi:hypothetical protein